MRLNGNQLTTRQTAQVLAAFCHRWTHENSRNGCVACKQRGNPTHVNGVPWHEYHATLVSDAEWLAKHSFHFVKDGSRLSARHSSCEAAK